MFSLIWLLGMFLCGIGGGIGVYYGGPIGLIAVLIGQIGISISLIVLHFGKNDDKST